MYVIYYLQKQVEAAHLDTFRCICDKSSTENVTTDPPVGARFQTALWTWSCEV